MNLEFPEISLKGMLLVPDGPPESVWRRALDTALADAGPQGDNTGEASPWEAGKTDDTLDGEPAPGGDDAAWLASGDGESSVPSGWEESDGTRRVDDGNGVDY